MKVGVIASEREEWHVQRLLESLKRRGIDAYVFPITRLLSRVGAKPRASVKGHAVDEFEAVIVRKVPGGSAEQVFYRMDALHRLEEMGVYVMNSPDGIERSVDKYYTSALLEGAGITTPKTVVTEKFDEAMKAFSDMGGDVVVKPLFGSLGFGMTRLNDEDIAYRVFRTLEMIGGVYYIQEYIPHRNEDIRAFVIGGRVVASMLRKAERWKTNIAGGGQAKPYRLEENLAEVSIRAAKTVGLEYTGVDILKSESDDGFYVVELNSTPGWEGLQTVTSESISDQVADHLLSKLK